MNPPELLDLPEVEKVARVAVKPGDVIVIECPCSVSIATAKRIEDFASKFWPDNKIVVLSDGMTLKIAEGKD